VGWPGPSARIRLSIVRCVSFMKRILSFSVLALAAGFGLRLYFVLKHPANNSGDTPLYEELATNWFQHHIYGMKVDDALAPVDLRMPGYPAFLALVYAVTHRVGAEARFYVLLVQLVVDLGSCLLIAALAAALAKFWLDDVRTSRIFLVALWLAALCPFTANYVATSMTETWALFFTAAALLALVALLRRLTAPPAMFLSAWFIRGGLPRMALVAGGLIGLGALFRPEAPLLLVVGCATVLLVYFVRRRLSAGLSLCVFLVVGCFVPLAPWAIRNAVALHEFQVLAPKNSNLPGELIPYGFMAWEKTWLFRVRDNYLVPWKLNGEEIYLDDLPPRAFDTPEERERVGMLLEEYNNDLTLSPQEDAAFAELARERTARRPLRTYFWLPIARGFTIWFTPRIELLPFSGQLRPIKQSWHEDPIDFLVTIGFFALNLAYALLALTGAWRLWAQHAPGLRFAVGLLLGYLLLRTAFLTTLETPEPRYVLVCFPIVLALAAQVFVVRQPAPSAA
jgi:hypothetical protein